MSTLARWMRLGGGWPILGFVGSRAEDNGNCIVGQNTEDVSS